MDNRFRPVLRRLGFPSAIGLALTVAVACAPGSQIPPVQITVLSPTPATTTGVGTPVAGAQAVPAVLTANASGNSISLVDPSTRTVLETINVGFPAQAVTLTPDGRYEAAPGRILLTCTGGAEDKCVRFGYNTNRPKS